MDSGYSPSSSTISGDRIFSMEKAIAWPCILAICIFYSISIGFAAEKKGFVVTP